MRVGVWPIFFTHSRSRTLAAEYVELAFMLCWNPSVWPTSCAATYSISRPMRSSGSGSVLARGSSGPTWTKYQFRARFITLWWNWMSLSMISPLRGSLMCGPEAFSVVDGSQRMTE